MNVELSILHNILIFSLGSLSFPSPSVSDLP